METVLFFDKCRLCLLHLGVSNIFSSNGLADIIFTLTGVKVKQSDNLPHKICTSCLEVIEKAKDLREVAMNNDRLLCDLFDVKDEEILMNSKDKEHAVKEMLSKEKSPKSERKSQDHKIKRSSSTGSYKTGETNEKKMKISLRKDLFETPNIVEKAAIESVMNQQLQQPKTEAPIVVNTESPIKNVHLESPIEILSSKAPPSQQNENVSTSSTYMEVAENAISDQRVEYILVPSHETNITTSTKNDTKEILNHLTVTVNAIHKNQTELKENQQQLLLRVISMQAQFEEFLKRSQKENLQKEIGFNPIDSLDSLQKLEDTLKDDRSTTELINKFSLVCGTGKGRGLNNCFTLVDVIFDRSFLTNCSWAGGARSEDKKKICFKSFGRVINLFFSVIFKSDKNFTMKECEEFFKNVIRNSNRRNAAKMARTSATKIRVKKNKKAPEVLISIENSQSEAGPSKNDAAMLKTIASEKKATTATKPCQNQNAPVPHPDEN